MIKKLTKLTKTLLVAAGLCVGATSAWAEATVIYGRAMTTGGDYTAWSSSDAAASGSDLNVWYGNMGYNENYGIYASGTGNRSSVMTFSHTANSLQTFDIVFNNLGNTGNGGNYSYIKIGSDIEIRSNQQNQNGEVIINGASTAISDCNQKNYNRGGDSWTIHLEINSAKKKVTAFTIEGTPGTYGSNTKYAHYTMASETALSQSATFNTVTIGFVRAEGTPATALTSIRIAEEAQAVTNVGYTINYKLGENLVKSVSSEDVVGSTITADMAVDGTETGYENHYLITAVSAPSMTLVETAASNVLDVPVRAPYTATLKVTTTVGENDPVLVETPLVETDAKVHTWSYAYPMYVLDGGKYYIAENTSSFGEGGEFTDGQVIEKSVTYSTVDESVVFFKDAEAVAGTNYSYSNGGSGYVGAQNARNRGISVGTLDAGIYSFIVNITAANRRSLGIRQSTNNHLAVVGTSNEDMTTGVKSANFVLNAETSDLWINGANSGEDKTNQSEDFDYVLIKKLPASVSGTITSCGWSTFASSYPLDLSTISGGTAYYASEAMGSNVTLTPTTATVPAGEGIMVKGTAGETFTINVAASGTAIEGNLLKGQTTTGNIAASGTDNKNHYVFGINNENSEYGFYNLAEAAEIPAGKAYLETTEPTTPARLSIVFNEEATAVSKIKGEESTVAEYYNLSGQRVAAPQKGLYIVNGQKVVIK